MRSIIPGIAVLLFSTFCYAQTEDSVAYTYDTTAVDSEYYQYNSEEESSTSTYTQNPGDLNPARKELEKSYSNKKFSKTEWKKIIGKTNYTEEPVKKAPEKKEKTEYHPSSAAWNPAVLKIIGFSLIVVLICVVIFFLLKNALKDESSIPKTQTAESLLYETHIDEVAESDLDRLLREALARKDFRAAIRLYYIRLLKHLNTTGHIAWKKDKTNHDYAVEVSGSSFTREFRRLMTAYEIIWYGERTPSTEEFQKLQENFTDLQRQARANA